MIANFQSLNIAHLWMDALVRQGWLFVTINNYKGGFQVHSGFVRGSFA